MKTAEIEDLSHDENLFLHDPLAYFGMNPVTFPVSDGSTVVVSGHAGYALRKIFGIDRVKSVNANGKRYLYTPFEIPDPDILSNYFGKSQQPRRWLFADLIARHVYRLHLYVPGDGAIQHNGSNSFLPSDYSRDQWPHHTPEPEPQEKASKVYLPKVGADLIQLQINWFSEPALRIEAVRWASKLTNPSVAQDIAQETYLKLFRQISGGQCEAADPKQLHDYVLTAVQFKCRTAATNGNLNGDVMPDLLARKGITVGMPETENLWHEMRAMERAVCAATYQD